MTQRKFVREARKLANINSITLEFNCRVKIPVIKAVFIHYGTRRQCVLGYSMLGALEKLKGRLDVTN